MSDSQLALFGGEKAVQVDPGDMFTWPIVTNEDETAILDVLHRRAMSDLDVTREFEKEFALWHDMPFALAHSSGTAALQAAMWACGVRRGDEIIGPSLTYWASVLPAFSLGATIVFAEIEPDTLCLDPNDIEHRITEHTRAIIPVHYCGYPADMDPIMEIAKKYNLKVIEDVSHAHGAHYKGRLLGTIGDCGAMSIMSGKALAAGEGGMLITRDNQIYQRAAAWGHYERAAELTDDDLAPFAGLPWGGYKYRMHQMTSAMGRVQLKHYKERCAEILKSMNYFWDLLEGTPGIRAHRPAKDSGSDCGGWYAAHGLYVPEELGGLHVTKFCEAVSAEGCGVYAGANQPLHTQKLFHDADIYGDGKPTIIANSDRDLRPSAGSLPVTEDILAHIYSVPWFKHYRPQVIEQYAAAFKKVVAHHEELLEAGGQVGDKVTGSAGLFRK